MNFMVDESVDRQIVDSLRKENYFVLYVAEMEPGISDDTVIELANQKELVIVTADKDFGELVFRQSRIVAGVVLIRLSGGYRQKIRGKLLPRQLPGIFQRLLKHLLLLHQMLSAYGE